MSENREEQIPSSPPIPKKGSYNIDFDSLDDTINPFGPRAKLSSSPPIQVRNTLLDDTLDPFKPKKKLPLSPPGSPRVLSRSSSGVVESCGTSSLVSDNVETIGTDIDSTANRRESENGSENIPKPKKIIKKPKVQSKLKPPKTIKSPQLVSDEIQASDPPLEDKGQAYEPPLDLSPPQIKVLPKKKQLESPNGGHITKDEKSLADDSNLGLGHHFDEHDVLEGEHFANEGFAPLAEAAFDNNVAFINKSSPGEGEAGKLKAKSAKSDSFTPDIEKPSPSQTPKKEREEDALLNTPPQVKQVDSDSYLSPELSQRDISRGSEKNESSSEDSQFYDAFDYPPAASTKPKLGQKNSSGMERGAPCQEDGGNNKDAVVQLVQVLRYSQSDWKKMKQELELNFQASLLNKEREWSLLLGERDKKISSLEDANTKLKHTNDEMRMIVTDFEKTISQLQADKDKSKTDYKKTIQTLESERDQAVEDLQSVESAFSDLHRRYEKSKSIIEGFKRNEEQLKQCVEDLQGKLKKAEGKLQAIRSQAEEKLDKANEDIEKIKKSTKQDIVRLEAALKKSELRTSSLEESLQRKEKENQELTAICDELIAKVGS